MKPFEQDINWYYLNSPCFSSHDLSIDAVHRGVQDAKSNSYDRQKD